MRQIINKFFIFIEGHPWAQGIFGFIGIILIMILIFLILKWFISPVDVIYEPNAPLFPHSFGGDDYH